MSREFEGVHGDPPLAVCVLLRSNWDRSSTTRAVV